MENLTSYRYTANSSSDYNALVSFITGTVPAVATLYPNLTTVVITPNLEMDVIHVIGKFIDDEGLNFQIEPIEVYEDDVELSCFSGPVDCESLQTVIRNLQDEQKKLQERYDTDTDELIKRNEVTEKKLKDSEEIKDRYNRWYSEAQQKYAELCDVINATKTLMEMAMKK